jgi:hypothetical protein
MRWKQYLVRGDDGQGFTTGIDRERERKGAASVRKSPKRRPEPSDETTTTTKGHEDANK